MGGGEGEPLPQIFAKDVTLGKFVYNFNKTIIRSLFLIDLAKVGNLNENIIKVFLNKNYVTFLKYVKLAKLLKLVEKAC